MGIPATLFAGQTENVLTNLFLVDTMARVLQSKILEPRYFTVFSETLTRRKERCLRWKRSLLEKLYFF